jgi:hypothetical protein
MSMEENFEPYYELTVKHPQGFFFGGKGGNLPPQ